MTANNEKSNILSTSEEDIEKYFDILKLFNLLCKISFKDYYTELVIPKAKKNIIFEKIKNKLKYLEDNERENDANAGPLMAINVFKVLFMKEKSFNLNHFSIKKNYFNIILNTISNKTNLTKEEHDNISELSQKIWNSELHDLTIKLSLKDEKNLVFLFSFYIIRSFFQSKTLLTDIFINFLKQQFKSANNTELELMKSYSKEELENIPINKLVKDFETIYDNLQNFIIFYVEKGDLKTKQMSIDTINEILKENGVDVKQEQKKDNLKQEKDSIENVEDENWIEFGENKIEISGKSENQNDIKVSKEIDYSQIDKIKTIDDFSLELKKIREEFENKMESQNKKFENKFEAQKKMYVRKMKEQKINIETKFKKKYETLENEIINLKKEKASINKKHKKIQKSLANVNKNLQEISDKCIDLEYELRLIQLRDPIKNIIDLFCNALNISLDYTYNVKIQCIKKNFPRKIFARVKYSEIFSFFDQIYDEFINSNFNAHSIELEKPILSQIFFYIDPDEKLKNFRIVLEKGKLNSLLKDLALKRINFVDKNTVADEEKKTIETVRNLRDLIQ